MSSNSKASHPDAWGSVALVGRWWHGADSISSMTERITEPLPVRPFGHAPPGDLFEIVARTPDGKFLLANDEYGIALTREELAAYVARLSDRLETEPPP